MAWKPQPLSDVPVYKQIADYYEEQIIEGVLFPGTRLPAERELAVRLSVNRSTVSAAYEELRAMGLVESVQGSGTRVSESSWEASPQRTPNWQRYMGRRTFDPAAALQRRIFEAAAEPGVINLTRGELSPDLMPLAELQRLAGQVDFLRPYTYHADTKGDIGLREAVSRFLHSGFSISADPARIMITAGVVHSLHLIAAALLDPGDAVAVEGPSYLYATRVFGESGLRMVKLPVDAGGLIPELLPELIRKYRVRMVFTNPTFQNPTGTTLSTVRRKTLLSICEAHRIPIVEDDPYGLLALTGQRPPLAMKMMTGGDRFVIYLGTLSKVITPGMRIGWIVAPEPVLAKLCDAKRRMGYSSSHAGERLAQLVLGELEWDAHLRHVQETKRRRTHLYIASQCRAAKALPLQSEKHSICESGKSANASFPFRKSTNRISRFENHQTHERSIHDGDLPLVCASDIPRCRPLGRRRSRIPRRRKAAGRAAWPGA